MSQLRELFSDLLVATGAAIVLFSLALVILIMVTAVPVGNPYIGFFSFVLLPTLAVSGGLIFVFGVLLAKRGGSREKSTSRQPGRSLKEGEDRFQ
jgi:hypothetical protein